MTTRIPRLDPTALTPGRQGPDHNGAARTHGRDRLAREREGDAGPKVPPEVAVSELLDQPGLRRRQLAHEPSRGNTPKPHARVHGDARDLATRGGERDLREPRPGLDRPHELALGIREDLDAAVEDRRGDEVSLGRVGDALDDGSGQEPEGAPLEDESPSEHEGRDEENAERNREQAGGATPARSSGFVLHGRSLHEPRHLPPVPSSC